MILLEFSGAEMDCTPSESGLADDIGTVAVGAEADCTVLRRATQAKLAALTFDIGMV